METWRDGYERRSCGLKIDDGEKIEAIYKQYGLNNINQFLRAIIDKKLCLLQISSYPEQKTKINKNSYYPNDYKYRLNLILSKSDGDAFNNLISINGCENASQLTRKIARGELILIKRDLLDRLLKEANVKLEDEIASLEDEIDT